MPSNSSPSASPAPPSSPGPSSIRDGLTRYTALFLVLVLAVSFVSFISLRSANRHVEAVNDRWLHGSRILGEMSDQISEFRLAETYLALARDERSEAAARDMLEEHRSAIADLQAEYAALAGPGAADDLREFAAAWADYQSEHLRWAGRPQDNLEPATAGSTLHERYVASDKAIDRVIQLNTAAAGREARAMGVETGLATGLAGLISIAATTLALVGFVRVRMGITGPLTTITQALTRLAAGDRSMQVPWADRRDEIGTMARAMDTFRANAVALEVAHEATRAAQERADSLARHDALTGLPNRRVFTAAIDAAVARAASQCHALLLIDLDRFKPVNDLLGHPVGDAVLCAIAERLQAMAGKGDTVARLGGDEFAMVVRCPTDPAERVRRMLDFAHAVVAQVREPIILDEHRVEIGASIGIAICPDDGTEPEALLRAADIAMYRAKQNGRATYRFFERSMDEELRAKSALEADLRKAIAAGEVVPYYQPLISLGEQQLCGFELLARWRHPVHGFVPADTFIPMIEQLGLADHVTSDLLRRACRDALGWDAHLRLSVNIWPAQLCDPMLPTRVLAVLSEEGFPPSRLEIEVTESALLGDIEAARTVLQALQSVGITISLDDFGTGYSSLYHLRELRFDKLKIDRSFVQTMLSNPESGKIVDAVLGLAHSLGMPTVAEGIEDERLRSILTRRGCEFGQGYLFSEAVDAASARQLCEAATRRLASA